MAFAGHAAAQLTRVSDSGKYEGQFIHRVELRVLSWLDVRDDFRNLWEHVQ
jgi:hypothetical protein